MPERLIGCEETKWHWFETPLACPYQLGLFLQLLKFRFRKTALLKSEEVRRMRASRKLVLPLSNIHLTFTLVDRLNRNHLSLKSI